MNEKFLRVCCDFYRDLGTTFPELSDVIEPVSQALASPDDSASQTLLNELFEHCRQQFPAHFFDILYKNADIFTKTETLMLLPNIDFVKIWNIDDISDTTRETLWKYLQLMLFQIVEEVDDESSFGDAARLFEAINEDELKSKMEEVLSGLFDISGGMTGDGSQPDISGINLEDLPDPAAMQDHIQGLMGGKLGKLAHEIAQETAEEFNMDMGEVKDVGDVFSKLFKNPGKMMGLVNKISSKLDSKMKSEDISQEDLMKEATDLMSKMKDMPGMPNIQELLKKMQKPGMAQGLMKQKMHQEGRMASQRDRLKAKLAARQAQQAQAQQAQAQQAQAQQAPAKQLEQAQQLEQQLPADPTNLSGNTFSDGSVQKQSGLNPPKPATETGTKKKKKKNKKK